MGKNIYMEYLGTQVLSVYFKILFDVLYIIWHIE